MSEMDLKDALKELHLPLGKRFKIIENIKAMKQKGMYIFKINYNKGCSDSYLRK